VRPYFPSATEIRVALEAAERAECRRCHTPVLDAEWKTVCVMSGIAPAADPGMRTCAKCLREQREANSRAAERAREQDARRLPSRPPLGLRFEN
jgi:hypothetical protein